MAFYMESRSVVRVFFAYRAVWSAVTKFYKLTLLCSSPSGAIIRVAP